MDTWSKFCNLKVAAHKSHSLSDVPDCSKNLQRRWDTAVEKEAAFKATKINEKSRRNDGIPRIIYERPHILLLAMFFSLRSTTTFTNFILTSSQLLHLLSALCVLLHFVWLKCGAPEFPSACFVSKTPSKHDHLQNPYPLTIHRHLPIKFDLLLLLQLKQRC